MKSKLLAGLVAAAAIAAFSAASALAAPVPQLWTDSTKTTPLRSVTSTPVNQPDALEFVGVPSEVTEKFGLSGVAFEWEEKKALNGVACQEAEFGTTVVSNSPEGEVKTKENKLAIPFGVAEGDECTGSTGPAVEPALVYFDTTAAGAVPANITIAPGPVGHLHKLKFSIRIGERFCTVTVLEGALVEFVNVTSGFVEESFPNLLATIPGVLASGAPNASVLCTRVGEKTVKVSGKVRGTFFLETMSTATDTAFIE
jgi:hypothetical protein